MVHTTLSNLLNLRAATKGSALSSFFLLIVHFTAHMALGRMKRTTLNRLTDCCPSRYDTAFGTYDKHRENLLISQQFVLTYIGPIREHLMAIIAQMSKTSELKKPTICCFWYDNKKNITHKLNNAGHLKCPNWSMGKPCDLEENKVRRNMWHMYTYGIRRYLFHK